VFLADIWIVFQADYSLEILAILLALALGCRPAAVALTVFVFLVMPMVECATCGKEVNPTETAKEISAL
jgi:hypothetical protein